MDVKDVKKIFVVGAGTMGRGLAQVYAEAGYNVTLYSHTQQTLDKAIGLTKASLETMAQEGLIESKEIPAVMDRIKITTSVEEGAKDTDIVQETVVDNVETKQNMFKQLDELCPPRTIIASNTSFLNIFDFAETSRPDKLLIAHWYMPPQLIPFVDVVKGPQTSEASLQLMVDILRNMGKKLAIMQKFIPGYIVNRLQIALNREIYYLLDNDYTTPSQIDEAARWGLALRMLVLGLLQRMDYGGIDMTIKNKPKE